MNLTPDRSSNTESLDPDDWEEFRRIAYLAVDDMIADLQSVQEHAAWQEVPELTKCKLDEPIPWKGQPLSEVYAEFSERIRPYPTGNAHPRFFGWVVGNGTPTGALADFLASWMNAHVAGCSQSATVIEEKVLSWLKELMGYPTKSSGLLVSGGTMANINALIVARNSLLRTGVSREQQKPDNLTIYGSSETHNWIMKACEVMGIGTDAFRAVRVNDRFQVDCTSLEESIEQDIRQGFRPLCMIGNVGTVNTGAIDDIARLRQIADRFGVWLHVDGAFGSMAAWGPNSKSLVKSQDQSDSLAFDLHKWGYMPYEVACVLIQDSSAHESAFAQAPAYLSSTNRGISVDATRFADRGIQLSRGFRALKVWMSMKQQGVDQIGKAIDRNVAQACLLASLVAEHPLLELLAPVDLNIVCFRYKSADLEDDKMNDLNQEVLLRIQESGYAVPSQTIIQGKFAIRACITNHRTTDEDIHGLVQAVVQFGNLVEQETSTAAQNH